MPLIRIDNETYKALKAIKDETTRRGGNYSFRDVVSFLVKFAVANGTIYGGHYEYRLMPVPDRHLDDVTGSAPSSGRQQYLIPPPEDDEIPPETDPDAPTS